MTLKYLSDMKIFPFAHQFGDNSHRAQQGPIVIVLQCLGPLPGSL